MTLSIFVLISGREIGELLVYVNTGSYLSSLVISQIILKTIVQTVTTVLKGLRPFCSFKIYVTVMQIYGS